MAGAEFNDNFAVIVDLPFIFQQGNIGIHKIVKEYFNRNQWIFHQDFQNWILSTIVRSTPNHLL